MSREYILLSTFERKTAFSAIYSPKRGRNLPFFRRFRLFRTAVKVDTTSSPPPQGRALPPLIVGPPSSSGAAHAVSLSKGRSGAADCGQGMTHSLPLSYWSPEKSYMTSSRTATQIYIDARFRVKFSVVFTTVRFLIVLSVFGEKTE
jgi:hypothetical protein